MYHHYEKLLRMVSNGVANLVLMAEHVLPCFAGETGSWSFEPTTLEPSKPQLSQQKAYRCHQIITNTTTDKIPKA